MGHRYSKAFLELSPEDQETVKRHFSALGKIGGPMGSHDDKVRAGKAGVPARLRSIALKKQFGSHSFTPTHYTDQSRKV